MIRFIAGLALALATLVPFAAHAQGRTGWGQTAESLRGHNGTTYHFRCPAHGMAGSVWGTGTYTDDSSVCTAAVHAGKITLSGGGLVLIRIARGRSSYAGSARHGITSRSYGSWDGSFTVVSAQRMTGSSSAPTVYATAAPAPAPGTISGTTNGGTTWDATAASYRGSNGQRYTYSCPANGGLGSVWGTDTYTDDSSVCAAAMHAGLITQAAGGTVTIEIRPGQSSYTGSSRNGVDSQNYDAWEGSFVFVRP